MQNSCDRTFLHPSRNSGWSVRKKSPAQTPLTTALVVSGDRRWALRYHCGGYQQSLRVCRGCCPLQERNPRTCSRRLKTGHFLHKFSSKPWVQSHVWHLGFQTNLFAAVNDSSACFTVNGLLQNSAERSVFLFHLKNILKEFSWGWGEGGGSPLLKKQSNTGLFLAGSELEKSWVVSFLIQATLQHKVEKSIRPHPGYQKRWKYLSLNSGDINKK